ncbi:MAG: reverse transcriptase family protein [Bacteroidales bacterium]|jgi:hypothetical protein
MAGVEDAITEAEIAYTPMNTGQYRTARIPKKSGGFRELCIPCDELKSEQRNILQSMQNNKILSNFPFACNGFRKYRSIRDNALPHVGAKVLLNCDLKDFFKSINRAMVREALIRTDVLEPDVVEYLIEKCTYDNHVPQGAPTSPFMSNLVMRRFDLYMMRACIKHGVAYTRYADDLSLSDKTGSEALVQKVYGLAQRAIIAMGLQFNFKKYRLVKSHRRLEVTGVVVNVKPNAPRRRRNEVRAGLHRLMHRLKAGVPIAECYGEYSTLKGYVVFSEFIRQEPETPSTMLKLQRIEGIIHARNNEGK